MGYLRTTIERMQGYVPGEQPQAANLVKLNTNENPYPPSPRVIAALQESLDERLRLYPDPGCGSLRARLGAQYQFRAEQVIVGNGCDDILNLCVRAFCSETDSLGYFWPSYSLYPVLGDIQGVQKCEIPLDPQTFQIDAHAGLLRRVRDLSLLFVTQPNAPSGVWLAKVELQRVIEETRGVVVIDEAYADFAGDDCLDFAREYPNVLVARSFSKSFALAGLRLGWACGATELIQGLLKVKDSYNVNRLSQIAAEAALEDIDYTREIVRRVCHTREELTVSLQTLGFRVHPSQANFVFAAPPAPLTAEAWFTALRQEGILIRWWDEEHLREYARVSIGTDAEIERLLVATQQMVKSTS